MFEAVAAEVSAAQNISRSRAGAQGRLAVSLLRRLPKAAEVFAAGDVDLRLLKVVITRTDTGYGAGATPGYLPGFDVLPAQSVREAARRARLKPVRIPKDPTEPGYRPSAAPSDFLRWRNLTCR